VHTPHSAATKETMTSLCGMPKIIGGDRMKRTRVMVFVALLISIDIVLTRILSFQTYNIRISFGFIAVAASAILFGPVVSGLAAALADVMGWVLVPKWIFFPGFTLSALLSGIIYGIFFYKKPRSLIRTVLAVLIITIFVDLGLNTLWLSIMFNKAVLVLITGRVIKSAMLLPMQVILIHSGWRYIEMFLERSNGSRKKHL